MVEPELSAYRPGEIALVTARCDPAPVEVRAAFADKPLAFFPASTEPAAGGSTPPEVLLAALAGIDLAAPPGLLEITWEAQFADGRTASGTSGLVIQPRSFPVQRLSLPRPLVEPDSASLERIRVEQARMAAILETPTPQQLWSGAFDKPVSSNSGGGFGARRVLNGRPSAPHGGLDLHAPLGAAVLAANSAVVVLVDTLYFAGKTVVLDHGLGLFTIYSHLSQVSALEGDSIPKGRVIGRVGATGRVTGPHLHWAVRLNGARVDPNTLLSVTASLASGVSSTLQNGSGTDCGPRTHHVLYAGCSAVSAPYFPEANVTTALRELVSGTDVDVQ